MEAVSTWAKKMNLNTNTQNPKQSMGSAKPTSKSLFWISVAVIDGLIFADFFLNGARISIDLLFFLTGGYGG